jgi:hypothetical protein
MGYLCDAGGVLSGMLPAPHDRVGIEVGPRGSERIYVRYRGAPADLLAAGAIDAQTMAAPESVGVLRDALLRPVTRETLPDGRWCITRSFPSIQKAADLPGIGGSPPLNVEPLRPRRPNLKLVVNEPGDGA